jgi:hypothetical protein
MTAAVVGLWLACGCSGRPSQSARALPELQATGTPAAPLASASPHRRSPASARGLTAAVRVVRRYYQVTNRLHRDMNPAALDALFTASCPCRAQVRAVRRAGARGEHYVDHATLNAVRPTALGADRAEVLVDFDAASGGLVGADGSRLTSAPPARHVQRLFVVERIATRWRIAKIEAIG